MRERRQLVASYVRSDQGSAPGLGIYTPVPWLGTELATFRLWNSTPANRATLARAEDGI